MIYATAKKRISIIVIITSLLLLIIGIKLSYLTIYRNNILSSLATDLWQRSLPLTASRGFIFDRNGTKLTYNELHRLYFQACFRKPEVLNILMWKINL